MALPNLFFSRLGLFRRIHSDTAAIGIHPLSGSSAATDAARSMHMSQPVYRRRQDEWPPCLQPPGSHCECTHSLDLNTIDIIDSPGALSGRSSPNAEAASVPEMKED